MPTKRKLTSLPQTEAAFVEPMECLQVPELPEGSQCYRAIAVRSGDAMALFSCNRKSLNRQFPYIVEALADLPARSVIDSGPNSSHKLNSWNGSRATI